MKATLQLSKSCKFNKRTTFIAVAQLNFMRNAELNKIKNLKSDSLREIALYLVEMGYQITFFGQAWSNEHADWVYFNSKLDLEGLKGKFKLSDNIIIHENLDPKSGTERGFIDKITGEGLMGKLH